MIQCPSCQTENPTGTAFCEECGAPLTQIRAEQAAVAQVGQPEQPAATPTAAVSTSEIQCPSCQTPNPIGTVFCEDCGAPLAQAGVEQTAAAPSIPAPVPSTEDTTPAPTVSELAVIKLIEAKTSREIDLPNKPEVSVGRRDPDSSIFPDIDMTELGGDEAGVSRRHCIIYRVGNGLQVEDLGSANYTYVNNVRVAPNERREIQDGAELLLGAMKLTVRYSARSRP